MVYFHWTKSLTLQAGSAVLCSVMFLLASSCTQSLVQSTKWLFDGWWKVDLLLSFLPSSLPFLLFLFSRPRLAFEDRVREAARPGGNALKDGHAECRKVGTFRRCDRVKAEFMNDNTSDRLEIHTFVEQNPMPF